MPHKELEDLMSAILGFGLALVQFFTFISPSPWNDNVYPVGKLEVCNLVLFLMRVNRHVYLESQRDFPRRTVLEL